MLKHRSNWAPRDVGSLSPFKYTGGERRVDHQRIARDNRYSGEPARVRPDRQEWNMIQSVCDVLEYS